MATERQKNSGLVINTPHLFRQFLLHILPPICTWCIVWISLKVLLDDASVFQKMTHYVRLVAHHFLYDSVNPLINVFP